MSAGLWKRVTIPLADLQGADRAISRVTIQAAAASTIPTFYVDDIHLVAGAIAPLYVHVDAGAVRGEIVPQMLGTNAAMWSANLHQNEDVLTKVRASGVTVIRYPEQNRQALQQFLLPLLIADFDRRAAEVYGSIRAALERQGTPIGPLDTLIAAHALSLDVILVTNNEREFSRLPGLQVINWASR